ncbi:3-deoxy-D-manno-octulosonic acid transferase [Sneathiella chinensis]|uniref:3-deoxy-D-manno-octulosonic acid transferase n=1 Tax=Sneathiella chinensis TaxID=349750 RepID=A0ABQ5U743_9PROT|nr:3-deoxy-D-manno-octulosonic acid transferase [Sneathiella chinensis]GLQ07718.1 3-deoxy-D-manno-octulosonic acid transferase [Sneathiella chinensis]
MYMSLYNGLLALAYPFIKRHMKKRLDNGKEDAARFEERFGEPTRVRPPGPLVWIHAASVGEAVSVLPLIRELVARDRRRSVLLTTGSVTSARLMQDQLPPGALHQFVPIDTKEAVGRFLDYWQPQAAVWMESEIWPNLINQTHRRHIPMLMINARITESSFSMWRKTGGFAKRLLGKFTYIHAQSSIAGERLKYLGAKNVEVLGNLKFCSPPLPFHTEGFRAARAAFEGRRLFLAASTHKGEEGIIAAAHQALKNSVPRLLTVIVPRHPERGDAIIQKLTESGLVVAQRSRGENVTPQTDIYLADTIGELGVFYRLADIVFIGGSLVEKGGQNPLEAARLNCAIMHGPHMSNFAEIAEDLYNEKAALRVNNQGELITATKTLFADINVRSRLSNNAQEVVKKGEALLGHLVRKVEETMTGEKP